jgi:hypothetical protein
MAKRAPSKPFVMITAALAVGCGAKFDIGGEPTTTDAAVIDGNDLPDVRPDTLPPGCPTGKPAAGAPCSPEGAICDYSKCYAPYWMGGDTYFCTKGTWMAGASSCNPPPPDPPCPLEEPTVGAPCTRSAYASKCQYRDSCPYNPTDYGYNDYACDGGAWRMTSTAYLVKCPALEPTNGSACLCAAHMPSPTCNYGDCYGSPTTMATCIGTAWSVGYLSCNPPPPLDAGSGP